MADMSEILDSYYEELDPDRRRKLFDEYLAAAGGTDPAADYRRALFEYRHVDPAAPDRKMDRFMLAFLDYLYLFRSSRILPGRYVKEVLATLKALEGDERVHTDPMFAEAFCLEVRNAVRRYFETCKTDGYHRKFFGIAASKPEEKEKQRCFDAWRMSYGLAERLGIEDEMSLFCKAVSDEYRFSRVDGLSLEDAYHNYRK